jgi:hypothetical protein
MSDEDDSEVEEEDEENGKKKKKKKAKKTSTAAAAQEEEEEEDEFSKTHGAMDNFVSSPVSTKIKKKKLVEKTYMDDKGYLGRDMGAHTHTKHTYIC